MQIRHRGSESQMDDCPDMAEINIIPLVDIMLVLLIIFMVAAPMSITGIGVQLPQSKISSAPLDESRIIFSIDENGDFYIDKQVVPAKDLAPKMKAIFSVREKKNLYIRADRRVSYGRVIDLMSAAKLAGVVKISMLTTHDKKTTSR